MYLNVHVTGLQIMFSLMTKIKHLVADKFLFFFKVYTELHNNTIVAY